MLTYPDINPVAVSLPAFEIFSKTIGPINVHWYGLMYLIGFLSAWWLARQRAKRSESEWTQNQVDDLIFYCALGVILGGRIGSILFYSFDAFLQNPLTLFQIWKGGMSFHGGLIGVTITVWLFGRQKEKPFFVIADFVTPLVPIGLGAGRIGNFINGELWGKTTDLPWGFLVNGQVRHPNQLYEALLEGLVLFIVLWTWSSRPRPVMATGGLFLLLYGVFRFLIEFVRLPDAHIGDDGYLAFGWLTMGQVLSAPMIAIGAIMIYKAYGGLPKAAMDTARSGSHEAIPGHDAARARKRHKKD